MSRGAAWCDKGSFFSWRPRSGAAAEVQCFHVELGDADAPPLVLVHGFPTSSIDWYEIAELLEHYVSEVLGLESMILYANDRGSSVAMVHTTRGDSKVHLEHLFLTNANICLPMSNLTQAQRIMIDPELGPAALAQGTPVQLAVGVGPLMYTPPRGADDPEIEALVEIFSTENGLVVLHETIQYLHERAKGEESWLKALAAMDAPTTFIWGVYDTISPPRVVNYVTPTTTCRTTSPRRSSRRSCTH